jgi:alanine racemase
MQDEFSNRQYDLFVQASTVLQKNLGYNFLRHIANSAAILRHPQMQLDMVRLGIGLYGVDSSASGKLDLQTVATLKSTIAQIRHLKAGETVGYNRKGVIEKDSIIATVSIGYADGFSRRFGNGAGKIWVKGQLAPVIGAVCMDMTMIDVTDIPGAKQGDEVTIFGKEIPIQDLANWAGTIPYEIMTGISERVKRVYYEE